MANPGSTFESNHERVVPAQPSSRPRSSKDVPYVSEHGSTVLYEPADRSSIVADIVFVHGLGGHPRKTWQYGNLEELQAEEETRAASKKFRWKFLKRKESSSSGPTDGPSSDIQTSHCFWPFDLVPSDFPNVRVMTYGYDSHPTHFYRGAAVQMTITQHSRQLLQTVTNSRSRCMKRPLVFVAHSLGGILVKDAMVLSDRHPQPHMQDVALSCRYMMFFGTPHQGATIASYGEMLAAAVGALPLAPSTYKEILHGLQPDSEKLSSVTATFNNLLDSKRSESDKIFLYSFMEGMPMTNLNMPGGKVLRSKIVPDTSAFFNREALEETSMIMANHKEMCKFDNTQAGYQDFRVALARHLERLQVQLAQEQQRQTDAKQIQEREEAQRQERERTLHLQQEQQDAAAVIGVLDFGERVQRQQAIANLVTSKATFDWMWQSTFIDWLASPHSLFWISGKPGSGKSTLMNYIAETEEARIARTISQHFEKPVIVVRHFFDFRADGGLGNDFKGFVRSLLVQIIKGYPNLVKKVPRLSRLADKVSKSTYGEIRTHETAVTAEDLIDAFRTAPDILFVALDGLDEYAGNRFELVSFIKGLSRCSNVKLCVASRPEAPFVDVFSDVPSLEMHRVNANGIREFAKGMFDDARNLYGLSSPKMRRRMAAKIVRQAMGVFIWARFAVLEVLSGVSEGRYDQDEDLVSAVNDLPGDLETLYGTIVGRMSKQDRAFARLVLLYVLEAQDTLRLGLLQSLFQLHHLEESHWTTTIGMTHGLFRDISQFERRLLASTRGLIEVHDFREVRHESKSEWETESSGDSVPHEELDATKANNRTAESATVDAHEIGKGGDAGDDAETALQFYSDSSDGDLSGTMSSTEPQSSKATPIGAFATVQLLHRTVKTYLERSGWAELSQSLTDLSRNHTLWLQSCVTMINRHEVCLQSFPQSMGDSSAFNYQEPEEVLYNFRRNHHDTRQHVQKSLSIGTHLLLAYVVTYTPHHAKLFEDTAGQSSYGVLSDTFRSSFWYMHFQVAGDAELCDCVESGIKGDEHSLTILQIAVSHLLDRFVGEYLEAVAVAEAPPDASRNTSTDHGPWLQHSFNWLRSRAIADIDPISSRSVVRVLALQQTFVKIPCLDDNMGTLQLALEHDCDITDDELLMAMARADVQVVQLLLETRPSGKLILVSESCVRQCLSEFGRFGDMFTHERLIEGTYRGRVSVRPFHAIGMRCAESTHGAEHAKFVIDLLLSRGEDLNEQCGPFGTVLHSFIDANVQEYALGGAKSLDLLLSRGADINALGPFGTALEFAWMLANTDPLWVFPAVQCRELIGFDRLINDLLDRGSTNNKADPNGIVPSIERMRDFGKSLNKFAEARRFYAHGPLLPGQSAAQWKDLHPDYDSNDADVERIPGRW